MKVEIRPLKKDEVPMLADFLYEAVFQRDEKNPIPKRVIEQPEVKVFIEDFGRKDDHCLVAVADGKLAGAVWTRVLSGKIRGFGNIDSTTPEFAISLFKPYRGKGIGTRLMLAMLDLLREKGYAQASLAVQKDNCAVRMYERAGFTIAGENAEEYIMVCRL